MANLGGVFRGVAELEPATTPVIYNLDAPLADTEVSQVLSDGTNKFTIRVRSGQAELKLAFVATESLTKFITIPKGNSFSEDLVTLTGVTLYVNTDKASQTVEILEWS